MKKVTYEEFENAVDVVTVYLLTDLHNGIKYSDDKVPIKIEMVSILPEYNGIDGRLSISLELNVPEVKS